jgi:hypothetical protein
MPLGFLEDRPLILARIGLLGGFAVWIAFSFVALFYIAIIILTRGEVLAAWDAYSTLQSMVLSLDIVAAALLALGFFELGRRHDYLTVPLNNLAIGFGLFALVTLIWRLSLVGAPFEDVNSIHRLATGPGTFSRFVPELDFLRNNYVGLLISAFLMFILMNLLVSIMRNYRAFENFQDVGMGKFRLYGLLQLVSVLMLGMGWLTFSPNYTGGWEGYALLGLYVLAWVIMFLIMPIVGAWVFKDAFLIHRAAIETLSFIIRRKAERDGSTGSPRIGQSLGTTKRRT